ncbi:MAG: SCO family protein [Candidatus Wenzhouxiangella sp. M2_3B_020]
MPLAACDDGKWYGTNVTGVLPDLSFTMTRARDAATVTEDAYRGQVVALFFGYTFCPDICPMTLANLSGVMDALGAEAQAATVLFVTVDPVRDTLPVLADYISVFTPRVQGLRGTDNQLSRLARRLRLTYKVEASGRDESDYAVSHGKTVYVFDRSGAARVIWPQFDTADADVQAAATDLGRLISA